MQSYYKDKQVLVTGGAGFIGSHIVESLVSYGAQVTVLDNLSTGNIENIAHLLDKIMFVHGSITDSRTCLDASRNKSHIFHLAAFISVPQSIENPKLCHEINVTGTFNLLEAAHLNNVQRFVFSSSSAVYGTADGPCSETTPCNPTSPYGFSKLIGEYLCKQYAQNFGLETVCLRYFNVFGQRQNPNGAYAAVVAKFKDLMQHHKPITIFGDGLQTRDFIPVQQVAYTNLLLGMLPAHTVSGELFNVASGTSITLLELLNTLKIEFPNYTLAPNFAPERPGDIRHSTAVCTKLQTLVKNSQYTLQQAAAKSESLVKPAKTVMLKIT
jgi:nucleoside-diphosphate-sugar epimerase